MVVMSWVRSQAGELFTRLRGSDFSLFWETMFFNRSPEQRTMECFHRHRGIARIFEMRVAPNAEVRRANARFSLS